METPAWRAKAALARTTSHPPRMMASGSPMASKQVRHSWAASRSASVRASSLASRSRLSRSSSAWRVVRTPWSRRFSSIVQNCSMASPTVSRR